MGMFYGQVGLAEGSGAPRAVLAGASREISPEHVYPPGYSMLPWLWALQCTTGALIHLASSPGRIKLVSYTYIRAVQPLEYQRLPGQFARWNLIFIIRYKCTQTKDECVQPPFT